MNDALQRTRAPRSPVDLAARQFRLESVSAAQHSRCLLCGAANPLGMRLEFRVQEDGSVLAPFVCQEVFQGYPETLHGGVIAALLDAAMTNVLFSIGVAAVTAELTVRFMAPVVLNQGAVARAFIDKDGHSLYFVRSELEQERKLMARATAKFLVKGSL